MTHFEIEKKKKKKHTLSTWIRLCKCIDKDQYSNAWWTRQAQQKSNTTIIHIRPVLMNRLTSQQITIEKGRKKKQNSIFHNIMWALELHASYKWKNVLKMKMKKQHSPRLPIHENICNRMKLKRGVCVHNKFFIQIFILKWNEKTVDIKLDEKRKKK